MKIKEYLNSLVSRRKSSTPSSSTKCDKVKSHHTSLSSTDCNYEICGYDDQNKIVTNDQHSRTQILLNRHAHLVNTIVGIRSQQEPSYLNNRISNQENLFFNGNYSSTLATCNPRREYQHQTLISTSNNSLSTKTRQRTKIRTNPWIKTTQISQPEYPTISSGLIHSESFPQTISNGNIHSINPSNIILHQSDSGQGFSLSSSRVINSSSPDNTSSDGPLLDEKQRQSYSNPLKTNSSDNKRKAKNRYQRLSNTRISSPKRSSITRNYPSRSSSPRLPNDHFSIEFEEIVENERLHKQRSPTRKSPFILPLDETDVQPSSSPSPSSSHPYSNTLTKTNSNTILQHIEEIENEIRLIKNLNLTPDEQILYSNEDERQSIHEQVDQWVDQCLTTSTNNNNNPTTLLHNQCNNLSNTIKDYLVCVYSNDNHQTSSLPKPQKKPEIMRAFYLSSLPKAKQTLSLNNPTLPLTNSRTVANDVKPIHECPF